VFDLNSSVLDRGQGLDLRRPDHLGRRSIGE
jgi:hypothetical protein